MVFIIASSFNYFFEKNCQLPILFIISDWGSFDVEYIYNIHTYDTYNIRRSYRIHVLWGLLSEEPLGNISYKSKML